MQRKIELLKPRDFGEIINDTFVFIRQNFKHLMKYFFIFCGFFMVATAATAIISYLKIAHTVYDPNSFDADRGPFRIFNLGYFINLGFLFIEYTAIHVTILCYMTLYRAKRNAPPDTEEMWGYFKFFYLKVLIASLVLLVINALGLVMCIIPGIYFGVVFSLVAPVMIVENTSFGYAFNQSFRLIRNNWWVTFGALIITGIIWYVARVAIVFPAVILGYANIYSQFLSTDAARLTSRILTIVLEQVATIFDIIIVIAAGLCYFNLTESKDGTGLKERMDQFGKTDADINLMPEEY
ncbi:MAG: hypothetical protein JST32_19155 [Bacteroidetes bacterium]|nr:hypothetical protein [Bacteroidota bacterium]